MAVADKMELGRALFQTLSEIQQQTTEIKMAALEKDLNPFTLQQKDGTWVLVPLLAARAQCLHALAIINQRD